jgi:hypothetical protein
MAIAARFTVSIPYSSPSGDEGHTIYSIDVLEDKYGLAYTVGRRFSEFDALRERCAKVIGVLDSMLFLRGMVLKLVLFCDDCIVASGWRLTPTRHRCRRRFQQRSGSGIWLQRWWKSAGSNWRSGCRRLFCSWRVVHDPSWKITC